MSFRFSACIDQVLIKYLFAENGLLSNSAEMPVVLKLDPLKH